VLLNDTNWRKLIRVNNRDYLYENTLSIVVHSGGKEASSGGGGGGGGDVVEEDENASFVAAAVNKRKQASIASMSSSKYVENPQLTAMYESKMWDMFKLLLDKCIGEREMDFSIIDLPVKSISIHPLMLIARSGQENLLKHEVTQMLLQLKWRFIPRFAFYFNLLFYMIFMLLYALYSIELATIGATVANTSAFRSYLNSSSSALAPLAVSPSASPSSAAAAAASSQNITKLRMQFYQDKNYFKGIDELNDSLLYGLLLFLLPVNIVKELVQLFLLDGLSYFVSLQNLIELLTYVTALLSLLSSDYSTSCAYGSIAVLFSFIVFPLFIQKLKMFGLYVVAFRRTLTNSAKFFPIFLIMFTGFILSFRIRANFDVSFFNTTSYSIIRTFTMVVGEMDTGKMGLYGDSLPNFAIYFLFIGLMCVIVLNLFVGIAVGEIKTVLDEADIQQTSMRIMFVLKVNFT
jgi:transient receptor potential cation channel subfamily A member 1